ncbi:hypothetical protein H9Y04_21110 [Streptomyces sp. TRM66268-LWL]|uniref:Uncharacterized protein n=1 Tax=Streptomyces polyasparticus TaxID=2767826 RepID=A0ABR7SII7_9ACTN|nr:hypothetical protein [Streptomyces polyasparticus]MBC9715054.1 hypothetical protein [Streptomyces polyasparticus]
MLIEVEKIAKFPWSPWLAQIQTSFGRTAVRWCGAEDAAPGPYHVEWTVDAEIDWGRNAKPAAGCGPGGRPGGHCVILRGRLNPTPDGAAVLELGDSTILLDLTDPLPEEIAGTWVELFLEREKISLYPYTL